MAMNAMAQEAVFALRQKIAKIEGTLPERLALPDGCETVPADAKGSRQGRALYVFCQQVSSVWTPLWAAACPMLP